MTCPLSSGAEKRHQWLTSRPFALLGRGNTPPMADVAPNPPVWAREYATNGARRAQAALASDGRAMHLAGVLCRPCPRSRLAPASRDALTAGAEPGPARISVGGDVVICA